MNGVSADYKLLTVFLVTIIISNIKDLSNQNKNLICLYEQNILILKTEKIQ